jgi:hypothetical protein
MAVERWKRAAFVVLLTLMSGCGSCSSDSKVTISDDDDGIVIDPGTVLYNGLVCEETTSSWRCAAKDGTSLDFAIYFLTRRGIAVTTPAGGSPTVVAFDWTQPRSDRVEVDADDGQHLTADDVDGSVAERFLSFILSGGDEPVRSFTCRLDDSVLDEDCDEVIEARSTATPTSTPTATPTATPTPPDESAI